LEFSKGSISLFGEEVGDRIDVHDGRRVVLEVGGKFGDLWHTSEGKM
jgi:hypothetical protein